MSRTPPEIASIGTATDATSNIHNELDGDLDASETALKDGLNDQGVPLTLAVPGGVRSGRSKVLHLFDGQVGIQAPVPAWACWMALYWGARVVWRSQSCNRGHAPFLGSLSGHSIGSATALALLHAATVPANERFAQLLPGREAVVGLES